MHRVQFSLRTTEEGVECGDREEYIKYEVTAVINPCPLDAVAAVAVCCARY